MFNFNVQNIEDGQGLAIAFTGMIIVFCVLTMISTFIVFLPKILAVVAKRFPETEAHTEQVQAQDADDGAVLAAIGYVLHRRRTEGG